MRIHYSDLLFEFFQMKDPNFVLTETPGGIKIVEWVYRDDEMFVGIFTYENELITWHIE